MSELRLKQISAGNSIADVLSGLAIALAAAGGCVKNRLTSPGPPSIIR